MRQEKAKALVIEDDAEIADLIGTTLQDEGFQVDYCDNGIKAFNSIESNSYSLITVDLDLPFSHGLNIIENIRLGKNKNARVFIIAGFTSEQSLDKVGRFQVEQVLKKPFDLIALAKSVNQSK